MMLHECYMFGKHITWFNPFAQRQLSHIMLEGYMFFLIAKGGFLLWQATSSMTAWSTWQEKIGDSEWSTSCKRLV